MEELLQAQLNAQRAGVSYAVVTIAEASGSVPRTSGKMLVYADGHSLGTIGGGPAERHAKADALAQLDAGQNAFLHYDFPTPGGASCAGRLSILIEVFQPKPLLVVFGGGHVGTSLLRLATPTGFRTLLLDDRAGDQIPDAVSLASRFVCIQNVERDILNTPIPEHAFFVLCGHDHAVDGEALAAALIPLIQPPIMKLLTSEEDRKIKMVQARVVSKSEKILFPIIVTIFVILLLPSTAPLVGCLMLGNLFRECGCTDRLSDTVQNALMNIVTIMLSTSVGATMVASNFLKLETLKIILLGLVAFGISTVGGLIGGNIMCKLSGKKVNPLIGSAGVSAVPMAARVSQMVGQKANPANFLLMHAMGPNVAGVIGSAIAAGFLLAVFG